MAIKVKNRTPKTTDFKKDDVVINITDGSLFYKSNKGLHKVATTTVVTNVIDSVETSISDLVDANPALTNQDVKDIVGSMFENNPTSNIDVEYIAETGVINLTVPIQSTDDEGTVISGNFYSIGLGDNNGTISTLNEDLTLKANHPNNQTNIENDKASIVLKANEAKTEINGDLITTNNTTDVGDNPVGVGKIETAPGGNITAGGNIRANKIVIVNPADGQEYYITMDFGWISLFPCTDADPCD